ncbi:MAG: hypothetical protein WA691_01365 [Thermoplasmata archaeon]
MFAKRKWTPSSDEEVLWNFGYAEIDSPTDHGNRWRAELEPQLLRILTTDDRRAMTKEDWANLLAAAIAVRGDYVVQLMALRLAWFRGHFGISELRNIRVADYPPFSGFAPSRRLQEFVRCMDEGRSMAGAEFADRYRKLRPSFDVQRVRGLPILVAESVDGPFTEVEGLTRLCILLSR